MLNKEDETSIALLALCKTQIIAIIALSIVVFSARQKDDVKVDYKVSSVLFSNAFEWALMYTFPKLYAKSESFKYQIQTEIFTGARDWQLFTEKCQ